MHDSLAKTTKFIEGSVKEMRNLKPFYFNRIEGEVVFVDPKAEIYGFWNDKLEKDERIPQADTHLYFFQANVFLFGIPGKGKSILLLKEETRDRND